MKTATVADLRNHFRRVSAWIENGESVEIIKRGKAIARLMPVAVPTYPEKADFRAQLSEVWGTHHFSDAAIQAMRESELEGELG